ncbi:acyl-CoA dehydrogenase family protein [Desulfosarcina sp.]|uniref:acyl-CoA dehydrogenase family protein n=1 Tax=Desulfosarcina sp. TaxID=2027861 RepID=UPI0029A75C5F|nr:acyl-CoA dehydrogenase family protein [Desulfosarcina sp.]MDX2454174.1 acyl-CoA dehydrogenase family protein [Desulfosarcina sp.]MDX2491856.1 acyl-CoA dehydrogenase family protein [Desulfosarcina sp.]
MDILTYTPEHDDFRQRLRIFCEIEVTPHVDQWEADGIVPKSIWHKMGQGGFLCPAVDPAYGGLGGDFRYSVIVAEELARTAHTGLAAGLHSDVVVPYIDTYGSQAVKRRYLPRCVSGDCITAIGMTEPDAGSDLAGIKTTAVEEGDTVVVNGSKTFISNGINCDLLVFAARDPAVENKYEAMSLYVVEDGTPGFTRGRKLDKMGWHSQDTAELFFSNCRIPVGQRLGEKSMGFLMLMEKLQQERLTCAVGAVCGAEGILAWTVDFCRKTNRGGRPMSTSQSVQFELVEMAADVKVGRTFVDKLVADHIEKKNIVVETAMAKFWTADLANRTADRALSILGDAGTVESCTLVRAWRDVRVMSIFAGTNEIMKGIAAKFMGL